MGHFPNTVRECCLCGIEYLTGDKSSVSGQYKALQGQEAVRTIAIHIK